MEINIFQVDAFSDKAFGGNPAAVVPNAKNLTDSQMQKIANEMNLSETAFVFPLNENLYKVRYFTPICEVDLCGHGSIATFHTLALKGYIKPIKDGVKRVYQLTKAGKLPVEIIFSNYEVDYVVMEQEKPKSLGKLKSLEILKTMNLNKEHLGIGDDYIEPEIISTGLTDILIPIRSKEILDNLKVDFCAMMEVTNALNVTGVHAYHLPEYNSPIVYARNFGPGVGINEESSTGTANGGLIYFLKKNNYIVDNEIIALQGNSLNRPSKIHCYIQEEEGEYIVKVGGKSKIVIDGIISF